MHGALFAGGGRPGRQALDRWCGGQPDEQTQALIDAGEGGIDAAQVASNRQSGFSRQRNAALHPL
jgi:hypothetical protein